MSSSADTIARRIATDAVGVFYSVDLSVDELYELIYNGICEAQEAYFRGGRTLDYGG